MDLVSGPAGHAGIRFDGRHYRYGPYRYDNLSDAFAYYELERKRGDPLPAPCLSDVASTVDLHGWDPDSAAELGVTFNGQRFQYAEFRYERLADALSYAVLDRARCASGCG